MKKVNKSTITEAAGIVGGAIAERFVSSFAAKSLPSLPAPVTAAAPLILGLLLSGQKSGMVKNIGLGLIAAGGASLAAAFIPGITGADDSIFQGDVLSLPADQSILSLPADQSILSGIDEREESIIFGADSEDEY